MRQIEAKTITACVERLCIEANYNLNEDLIEALEGAQRKEESPVGIEVLTQLIENARIGRKGTYPVCQDTGFAVIFVKIGQGLEIIGGDLYEAITRGVAQGYKKGYLRASIVRDPLARVNTGDNTPPVIHTEVVPGDNLQLTVMAKGGGCENMSRATMLIPAKGRQGVIDFVVDTARRGAVSACPPIILGVGIGGPLEMSTLLAKQALLRPIGRPHQDSTTNELERELLEKVNNLGIGPQGWGGRTTALAVHVEKYPCHIASLPVAVNVECHSHRVNHTEL